MEILLNEVSYIYDEGLSYEKHALLGVDLSIKQGEWIGLIGPTGSGKSTLVKMMNGLLKPTYGGVYVDGADINDKDYALDKLRGRIGMVFQYPEHQLFESTVLRDVEFGPINQGLKELDVELRAFEALKAVGIGEELLDVSPLSLSGGQKRRVAIAGVLAMKPEVLILDEPTAGLDPYGRDDMFALLHRLHDEGITVILISHRMEDVAENTDRVIVMNNGRIVKDMPPSDLFSDETEVKSLGLTLPASAELAFKLGLPGGIVKKSQIVDALISR